MTTKNTTNFPRALLADVFGALHSESPLTPGSLLHAAIGEASRALRLASIALQRGELHPGDLDAIRRRLVVADNFAEWLADDEADERGQSAAEPPADALRTAIDLCNDEIIDDLGMALGRLEDARRASPDADPQPHLDQAIMESHNAVTAAFGKLARTLGSRPPVPPKVDVNALGWALLSVDALADAVEYASEEEIDRADWLDHIRPDLLRAYTAVRHCVRHLTPKGGAE